MQAGSSEPATKTYCWRFVFRWERQRPAVKMPELNQTPGPENRRHVVMYCTTRKGGHTGCKHGFS